MTFNSDIHPINVLHVYPEFIYGGVERVIENLIHFGDRQKFKFSILVQKRTPYLDSMANAGITIHCIPFSGNTKDYGRELDKFFALHNFQVVHTHMHHQMTIVNRAARRAGIKCRIAHSHIDHPDWPKWKRLLRIPKFILHSRHSTTLIGASQASLDWLFPPLFRRKPSLVVENGIDLKKYESDSIERSAMRKELGIDDNERAAINVGRCASQKNQDFILDIAKIADEEKYVFIIAGDGPLLPSLKHKTESLGLRNVKFLGQRNDIGKLLQAADIFLLPSTFEAAVPIVALEALASGLPVLAKENLAKSMASLSPRYICLSTELPDSWVKTADEMLPDNFNTPEYQRGRHDCSTSAVHFVQSAQKMAQSIESIYLYNL